MVQNVGAQILSRDAVPSLGAIYPRTPSTCLIDGNVIILAPSKAVLEQCFL